VEIIASHSAFVTKNQPYYIISFFARGKQFTPKEDILRPVCVKVAFHNVLAAVLGK